MIVRSPGEDAPLLVLVDASSEVERTLIEDWMRDSELRPAAVLPASGTALAQPLAGIDGDAVVAAVRVAWLPRERNGQRRVRWSDLASLRDPRHPNAREQARIVRREPDRVAVVAAEPATVTELRDRWGGRGTGAAFGEFVARQAALALDRAERALVGGRYKVPSHIVEAIVGAPDFRRDVRELAARTDLPEAEVAAKAEADLHGLVASMSPMAVDLLSAALRPLHARAWDVQVDTAGLERLRELNRRYPLVFLPSHRSYADPLLLADVLAEHDFPRNHVLGGDNLRFWPVGPLAKRAGIVFIRRSFGDDEVYKLAVREYFGFLLSKRFNLEWYMEGGRSRTGKLRPPRYGLLANVAEAVERGRAQDVYLVPVSIAYDQLREVSAMAAEQRGAAKKGEGLGWLARYAKAQLSPIGNAHVRFAEPISLRGALEAGADAEDPDARRLTLQKVAFEVAVGINRVTPVMATALVTLALLGVRDRALTLGQVRRVLEPVREYVLDRGLPRGGDALSTQRGRAPDPGRARRAGRRDDLHRWRGARVRDRAGPAPRRGVLPQQRDPPLRRPCDRGADAALRARRPRGGGGPAARPAQVRVLLPRPGHPQRAARRGAGAHRRGPRHGRRPGRAGAHRFPLRPPGAALLLRRPAGGGRAARRTRPAHPGGGEGVPRRVRGGRPADAAAGPAARTGVAVAGAVRQRAAAGGEPGPARSEAARRAGRSGGRRSPRSCATSWRG